MILILTLTNTYRFDKFHLLKLLTNLLKKKSPAYLGGGDNGEGVHDSVGVLLTDLADEEGSHARASATAKGVCQLESWRKKMVEY